MALKIVTYALVEPVSRTEAKAFIEVDHSERDDLIDGLIRAAREHVENYTNRALVTQTWDLVLDTFPCTEIMIPKAPVRSIVGIYYYDEDGIEQTVSNLNYYADLVSEPPWIVPGSSTSWPTVLDAVNSMRVRFIAGYEPDTDSPSDLAGNVPSSIKTAIKMLVSHWFERREPVTAESIREIPMTVDALLYPYRIFI